MLRVSRKPGQTLYLSSVEPSPSQAHTVQVFESNRPLGSLKALCLPYFGYNWKIYLTYVDSEQAVYQRMIGIPRPNSSDAKFAETEIVKGDGRDRVIVRFT